MGAPTVSEETLNTAANFYPTASANVANKLPFGVNYLNSSCELQSSQDAACNFLFSGDLYDNTKCMRPVTEGPTFPAVGCKHSIFQSGGINCSKPLSPQFTSVLYPASTMKQTQLCQNRVFANYTGKPGSALQSCLPSTSAIHSGSARIPNDFSMNSLASAPTDLSTRAGSQMNPHFISYYRHHSTRASPITVQWLLENYESADGVSLSRSALYSHYLSHCLEHWLEPMNPASFGKLIRSVFVGLRTRRLGTRGNSKYHYYGIRIKTTSTLNQTTAETRTLNCHTKKDQYCNSIRGGNICLGSSKLDVHRSGINLNRTGVGGVTRFSGNDRSRTSLPFSTRAASLSSGYGNVDQRSELDQKPCNLSLNSGAIWRGWDSRPSGQPARGSERTANSFNYHWSTIGRSEPCSVGKSGNIYGVPYLGLNAVGVRSDYAIKTEAGAGFSCQRPNFMVPVDESTRPLGIFKYARSGGWLADRTYFGSSPDHKFSLPKLHEICQVAGLPLTESDLFICNVKSEPYEEARDASAPKVTAKQLAQFVKMYEAHCEQVYSIIINLQLDNLRSVWHQFWRSTEGPACMNEFHISKDLLVTLCENNNVCQFVEIADRTLYQGLLEIIINDSLKAMPAGLIHGIRVLIKLMEPCLRSAIRQYNPSLINTKLAAVSGFTKGLRRALGLTHLSQAVESIIRDPERLREMMNDINKLDLDSIEAQGSWASECPPKKSLQESTVEQQLSTALDLGLSVPAESKDKMKDSVSGNDDSVDFDPLGDVQFNAMNLWERITAPSLQSASGFGGGASDLSVNKVPVSQPGQTTGNDRFASRLTVSELHADVCSLLANKANLPAWTTWLDQIVSRILSDRLSGPKRATAARQLMLVWTYYSSLLMRELTLRSAVSFSSCHLLRMLCDEYLSYRLEQVASSPLTLLPKSSEYTAEERMVLGGDLIPQSNGLISDALTEGANTLTSLNDNCLDYIDSQILSSGYEYGPVSHCQTPQSRAQGMVDNFFGSKSPDSGNGRLLGQEMSELERSGNYFSLGFCGDPLLTESNTLPGEKSVPLNDITESWQSSVPSATHNPNGQETVFQLGERTSTPHPGNASCDYLASPSGASNTEQSGSIRTPPHESSEPIQTLSTPKLDSLSTAPTTTSLPSVKTGRSNRKPSKPHMLRQEEYIQSFFDDELEATLLKPIEAKDEKDPWSSSSALASSQGQGCSTQRYRENDSACHRFLKPFSSHTEKRIVAALNEDEVRGTFIQTPRKTVCITIGAEEQNK
ncbi:unnamed protein product [Calicophoron daubneyi]